MTETELKAICSRLAASKDRLRDVKITRAQAELDAINREYSAYCDGVDDAIRAIRGAMQEEGSRCLTEKS